MSSVLWLCLLCSSIKFSLLIKHIFEISQDGLDQIKKKIVNCQRCIYITPIAPVVQNWILFPQHESSYNLPLQRFQTSTCSYHGINYWNYAHKLVFATFQYFFFTLDNFQRWYGFTQKSACSPITT